MPLVDSNSAALWDGGASSLYRCYIGGQAVGYSRAAKSLIMGDDADMLVAALVSKGLAKGQRIALIGAGFGWVGERLIELGYGPAADGSASGKVCSVDTSTWVQANKAANATTTIVSADVNGATGRRTIRQQFGSNNASVDWCVTEDVLPVLSDSECSVLAAAVRGLASNVAHWVSVGTPSSDPRLNWKTLQQWKALVTPDWVVQRGTATVL